MALQIGVPREVFPGEKRVATVPEVVEKLVKQGFRVAVEAGAGEGSQISDDAYRAAGAEVVADRAALWATSDIVFKVRAPDDAEIALLREGGTLVSFLWPAQNPELMQKLAARRATVLAMDSVPRISRAQKMDALSSMANIGGYRAVIEAAHAFGRFFTGSITAAGKVPPAKVFVIGAGVAGLAAIGAASGLGAIVRANDTRPEVGGPGEVAGRRVRAGRLRGGRQRRRRLREGDERRLPEGAGARCSRSEAKNVDIIITTALIPGKPAPKLITEDDGAVDEAGQRHRRHGGRAGRQLRADRAGPGRRARTASRSSATPTCRAGSRSRRRRCTRTTCCASSRTCVKTKSIDGERDRRRHERRGAARHDGRQRRARSRGRRRRPSCRPRRRAAKPAAAVPVAPRSRRRTARPSGPMSPAQDRGAVRRRRAPVPAASAATRRRRSSRTSRCSCSRASSATWSCGTSRPRCTRR